MDSVWLSFLSSLIGGFIALTGTYLAHHFALRKDREQWERQREAERQKLAREVSERAGEHLQQIYSNCIRSITQFDKVRAGDGNADFDDLPSEERKLFYAERAKHFVEAQHWLWLLSINLTDVSADKVQKFNEAMKEFVTHEYDADTLRDLVLEFAQNDSRLKIDAVRITHLPPADSATKVKELQGI